MEGIRWSAAGHSGDPQLHSGCRVSAAQERGAGTARHSGAGCSVDWRGSPRGAAPAAGEAPDGRCKGRRVDGLGDVAVHPGRDAVADLLGERRRTEGDDGDLRAGGTREPADRARSLKLQA